MNFCRSARTKCASSFAFLLFFVAVRSGPLILRRHCRRRESSHRPPSRYGAVRALPQDWPDFAGRVKRLDMHVGDTVKSAGRMDAVVGRSSTRQAAIVPAPPRSQVRKPLQTQAARYRQLLCAHQ